MQEAGSFHHRNTKENGNARGRRLTNSKDGATLQHPAQAHTRNRYVVRGSNLAHGRLHTSIRAPAAQVTGAKGILVFRKRSESSASDEGKGHARVLQMTSSLQCVPYSHHFCILPPFPIQNSHVIVM